MGSQTSTSAGDRDRPNPRGSAAYQMSGENADSNAPGSASPSPTVKVVATPMATEAHLVAADFEQFLHTGIIPAEAFMDLLVETAVIPDGITRIGDNAFEGMSAQTIYQSSDQPHP